MNPWRPEFISGRTLEAFDSLPPFQEALLSRRMAGTTTSALGGSPPETDAPWAQASD